MRCMISIAKSIVTVTLFRFVPAEMNSSGILPSTFLCVAVNTISSTADNITKGERVYREENMTVHNL